MANRKIALGKQTVSVGRWTFIWNVLEGPRCSFDLDVSGTSQVQGRLLIGVSEHDWER